MVRMLKVLGYLTISIVLILIAPRFAYFISPFFAILHRAALVLSAFCCIIGIPIRAYLYSVEVLKDPADRYLAVAVVVWLVCAVTQPNITKQEIFTVYGVTSEYRDQATAEYKCHCLEDAKETARRLYKERQDWARNSENGRFAECDVKIEEYTAIPALNWMNRLLGTNFDITTSDSSIRWLDAREDPLGITDASRYDVEPDGIETGPLW